MDTDKLGKDKGKHFLACMLAACISPYLALGLAIGKEYGDRNAIGNHWCWWDVMYDALGILAGSAVHFALRYLFK